MRHAKIWHEDAPMRPEDVIVAAMVNLRQIAVSLIVTCYPAIGGLTRTFRLKLLTYIECKKEVWRVIILTSIMRSCCEVAIANSRRGWTSGIRNLSAVCAVICPLAQALTRGQLADRHSIIPSLVSSDCMSGCSSTALASPLPLLQSVHCVVHLIKLADSVL